MDPEQLAAAVAVADESLAAQTADYGLQAAIAQHRPDLWAALASNPTTYPGLLEWLSGIQEPAVRLALEARGIAPQTEAVPQAGEGVPGDARPEGPVEPPAGEAEAAESPDSPSGEAEPAESPADEAAPEETDSEVAADAPADEDEPADSPSDEAAPEEDAPGPEAAAESPDSPSGEAEPADSRADGGAPTETIEAGTDEAEPEADASDEPVDSPADENEPVESPDSPSGEAEPADEAAPEETDSEVADDASTGDSAPEGEPVEPPAEEPADSRANGGAPTETIETGTGEAALAGVSLGEVPAPPPETPASTPGTALSAGFASQPAVAPGSFFVPTQAQAAGSLGSAPSPSRTRKPVIIVVILALLLAGGAGGWFLMSVIYDTPITLSLPGQGHKAHRGGGKAAGDSTASDSTPGSVDPTGTSATNYVTPCGSAPTFTPTSVKDGDGELKVEVKVTASCPSGDVLGGTANHIELKGPSRSDSTGSADAVVASGDFDFSDSPLVIPDSGTTLTLRFGEGHFFRTADDLDVKTITVACTPDRASGTSGATAGVPSASGSSNPSSVSASASTTSQDSASEESAAESSLKWQVDHDRPSVTKDLTGKWVAQLSSKKPGMTADGMTWDNRTTLQEFLKLRQKYPTAKLLYSEDWPVFDAGGKYWVTIAGTPYSTAAEANAWCDAQGFDAEHCFAKYIDTNGPSEGTTVNR